MFSYHSRSGGVFVVWYEPGTRRIWEYKMCYFTAGQACDVARAMQDKGVDPRKDIDALWSVYES